MRKVVFGINITADGCCDHTKFNPDGEVLEYYTKLMREAGVLLYGRKTYELMVPYWPEVAKNNSGETVGDNEFAQAFASVPEIVVFSNSLGLPDASNTRVIRAHPRDEILKLKQGQGGNILTGGVSFPSELLELGLIDEIQIVIYPVVIGKGRRLFDGANLQEKLQMKLIESRVFKSGAVLLRYFMQ